MSLIISKKSSDLERKLINSCQYDMEDLVGYATKTLFKQGMNEFVRFESKRCCFLGQKSAKKSAKEIKETLKSYYPEQQDEIEKLSSCGVSSSTLLVLIKKLDPGLFN